MNGSIAGRTWPTSPGLLETPASTINEGFFIAIFDVFEQAPFHAHQATILQVNFDHVLVWFGFQYRERF